jgi:hypothetical protein
LPHLTEKPLLSSRELAVSFVFQLEMVWRWGVAKNIMPPGGVNLK